jgi:hypothetical protein
MARRVGSASAAKVRVRGSAGMGLVYFTGWLNTSEIFGVAGKGEGEARILLWCEM